MTEISAFLCAILLFGFLCIWMKSGQQEKILIGTYRELSGFVREKSRSLGWYQNRNKWLLKKGAPYHYGKSMDPMKYLLIRLGMGACGLAIGKVSPEYGLVAFGFLFWLPSLGLIYLNKKDNEKILPELKLIYHSLEIQIKAGVYITDALAECYGSVRQPRLRQALLDLAGDIVMKADIYQSLNRFQEQFENRYVDSLCITILQALESGQAVELLKDIGEQMKDMEESVFQKKKASLDRSITFYQLGVMSVVLGIALYACVTYMFGAAVRF